MLMALSPRFAGVIAILGVAATRLPRVIAENACSFVPDSFYCSLANAQSFSQQCSCFSCKETNGVGFYQCNGATVCSSNYTSTSVSNTTPEWWISAYISVGVVFVVISVLVYAALRVLARFSRVVKDDTDKDPDVPELPKRERVYRYVYGWAFGALYKSDGTQRRSFGEFCIAGCELLDCCWCCLSRKELDATGWRPFYLRAMPLVATLTVGASLGLFYGSLEFDATKCYTHRTVSLCTLADTNVTTISCDNGPEILDGDSFISSASIVAFVTTQCVKYIASYAYNVGKPRSKLDIASRVMWLLVALVSFPICYAVSSSLLSASAYDHKTSSLRVRWVVSITLSTWIKDQLCDLVRVPAVFAIKRPISACFRNPLASAKKPAVEPMPFELAPPSYAASADDEDFLVDTTSSKVDPHLLELECADTYEQTKIDTITSPRPTMVDE